MHGWFVGTPVFCYCTSLLSQQLLSVTTALSCHNSSFLSQHFSVVIDPSLSLRVACMAGQELLMCDSMDLDYQHNGLAWMEVPNPESGEPGYPRVLIESRVYESSLLRKMHLMVGVRQDGLMVGLSLRAPSFVIALQLSKKRAQKRALVSAQSRC